ncbi:GSCOCG00010489001-RA-CDS [Cotesia congregata]|uniref:Nitric oxide synthase-interacting protein homolog n=1 Tax=Cotesia congregata TaxID=51543 RepID=A0A8J2H6V6_COTCN|nr:GSCOCG00010489001-RA-CDS [Cotesia congregata]CAG5080774.1 Similar to CG6179: Nitric oxide synthase-interacting protein homolog (Drosophila melanogaster) [Cotesia congregata]
MTRHARNCTAGAVYTYHEKKKDAAASGYGTNSNRIGKDSVKGFDCCCLTLQPCRNPVITPDGYLFDKEAILEYILSKKREYSRKLKEYEAQKRKEEDNVKEETVNEELKKFESFLKCEKIIVASGSQNNSESSVSNMANGRDKMLPSFWIPSKTPEAKAAALKKPDKNIYCPVSGNVLKLNNLIPIKFTEVKDPDDKKALIVKEARYMCPITHDILGNSVPCAVIKTTGDVVTMECVEKLIKKDWINPLDNSKISESDIIPLQRGGTGYAAVNDNLEGKHERPVLQA